MKFSRTSGIILRVTESTLGILEPRTKDTEFHYRCNFTITKPKSLGNNFSPSVFGKLMKRGHLKQLNTTPEVEAYTGKPK